MLSDAATDASGATSSASVALGAASTTARTRAGGRRRVASRRGCLPVGHWHAAAELAVVAIGVATTERAGGRRLWRLAAGRRHALAVVAVRMRAAAHHAARAAIVDVVVGIDARGTATGKTRRRTILRATGGAGVAATAASPGRPALGACRSGPARSASPAAAARLPATSNERRSENHEDREEDVGGAGRHIHESTRKGPELQPHFPGVHLAAKSSQWPAPIRVDKPVTVRNHRESG